MEAALLKWILNHKLVIVLIAGCFYIADTSRHIDAGPKQRETDDFALHMTDWPDVPYVAPTLGEPIALPRLEPMPLWYRAGFFTLSKSALALARQRLETLVAAHPDKRFREAFTSQLASGALEIEWANWSSPEKVASFCLEPVGFEPGQTFDPLTIKLQPTMFIRVYAVNDADTWDEQIELLLTLTHEFEHARQAARESDPERRVAYIDRAYFPPTPQTPEQCEQRWTNEREAYALEAQDMFAWGYRDGVRLLDVGVNTPAAFDQRLAVSFAMWYGGTYPECMPVWASLAGAPKPS